MIVSTAGLASFRLLPMQACWTKWTGACAGVDQSAGKLRVG